MYEPVGYTADADTWCEVCLTERYGNPDVAIDREDNPVGALFQDSESDTPSHCAGCGELLDASLTDDGREYVRGRLLTQDGNPEVLAAWAANWPNLASDA